MLDTMVSLVHGIKSSLMHNGPFLLSVVGLLWGINLVNSMIGYRLNVFGILPRHPWGLVGIFTAPFLHGSFNHLFMNSVLMLALGGLLMMGGLQVFIEVSVLITLLSGIMTWFFGRKALHVGSSAVIMGYWGYMLVNAYQHPTLLAILLGGACFYYFTEMAVNLMPSEPGVSWEGHCFGFIAGILVSIFHVPFFNWFAEVFLRHVQVAS